VSFTGAALKGTRTAFAIDLVAQASAVLNFTRKLTLKWEEFS